MSVVLPAFRMKSLRSGFWTSLFGPCPDEPVIDFTAILTLGITTLSITVKIASCMRVSTIKTALSTSFLILLSILFCVTWFWLALSTKLSKSLSWPLVTHIVPLPIMKSLKISFNWLSCFFADFFSYVWKPFSQVVEVKTEEKLSTLN